LDAFVGIIEGILDRCEDLSTDGSSSFSYSGSESKEMTSERSWERLSSAEKGGDLHLISIDSLEL
jgi:hypothetical protein